MKKSTTFNVSAVLMMFAMCFSLTAQENDQLSTNIDAFQVETELDISEDFNDEFVMKVEAKPLKPKGVQRFYTNPLSRIKKNAIDESTAKRTQITLTYGEPDYTITGDEIRAKRLDWNSGLYSALYYGFRDRIWIQRTSKGRFFAQAIGAMRGQHTFVMVDGIVVPEQNYFMIENITVNEIVRVDVIEQMKPVNYPDLYQKTFFKFPTRGPFFGNIISIYTKTGEGLFKAIPEYIEEEVVENQ